MIARQSPTAAAPSPEGGSRDHIKSMKSSSKRGHKRRKQQGERDSSHITPCTYLAQPRQSHRTSLSSGQKADKTVVGILGKP